MRQFGALFWGIVILGFSVLFIETCNDPFFGDSIATISRAGNHIFESDFSSIEYPNNLDPGHPLTFSIVHAALWKLFGKHVWVSHLLNSSLGFFIVVIFVKWGRKLGYGNELYLGGAMLVITPLFVSQVANPNLHLPLTLFTLGFVYSLQYGKVWHQVLFATAMLFTHLQGLYYLTPIWLWWFCKSTERPVLNRIQYGLKVMVIPMILFFAWMMYHHAVTGWYLSSPNYSGHRGFPGIKRFIVNLILADWRIVDFGQIALWILPIYALFKKRLSINLSKPFTLFLILFLFNAIAIGFTTKTGPTHRYLLPCLPFLIMGNVAMLKEYKFRVFAGLFVLLFSGHFWFYPGKVIGDATLAYRSVFPLLDQAKAEFNDVPFYSYAPLSNPSIVTALDSNLEDYKALYDVPINGASHVIYTNINGDFGADELKILHSWPSKTYEKGYVYLEVYSNPVLVDKPIVGPKRQPSAFEYWFVRLKNTVKGKDGA
ncbi:MAG: hypothetical protein ACI9UJ_000241 [bacterium]|jgi:hypothetical protein